MNDQNVKGVYKPFDGYYNYQITRQKSVNAVTRINIDDELWSAMNYYAEVEDVGKKLIHSFGTTKKLIVNRVFSDFQSYIRQAKSFYDIAKKTDSRSAALLYYYSFLNLVKAGIVIREPSLAKKSLYHGLSYNNSVHRVFEKEVIKIDNGKNKVFSKLYELYCGETLKIKEFNISKLFGYCQDISLQFDKCGYGERKILPAFCTMVSNKTNKVSWSILAIYMYNYLKKYKKTFKTFLDNFEQVDVDKSISKELFNMSPSESSISSFFQSKINKQWIGETGLPVSLCSNEVKLSFCNTLQTNFFNKDFNFFINLPYCITNQVPMNEMLAIYLIMFYLSNLVRYKPYYLEELLNKKDFWMIDNFIKSCPVTFLRNGISWIINEDYILLRE